MDGARKWVFTICCAIGGAFSTARGAAFTPGDIVVFEAGNGSVNLTSGTAAASALLEFSPTVLNQSAPIQTIPLPSIDTGDQHALTTAGQYNDHLMTLSTDGRYLSVMGYDVPAGSNYIDPGGNSEPAYASPNRTIARIDASGQVDTSTAGAFGAANTYTRGTASVDGSGFWYTTTSASSASPSVGYVPFGTSTPTILSSNYSGWGINIYGGQLYSTSVKVNTLGVSTIGTNTPTSGSPPISVMPDTGGQSYNFGPTGFFMATLKPGDTQPDVLYVCDYYSSGEIDKYSLVNGIWVWNGEMPISFAYDLTASVNGGVVTLYTTSIAPGTVSLSTITDTSGYNSRPSSTAFAKLATMSTAGNTIGFRGLALAPTAGAANAAVWNSTTGGNWSTAANWIGGVPNAVGASVTFGTTGIAPQTVSVDSAQTVGSITFSSSAAYTIGGAGALTLSNSSGSASINVASGNHVITAPLLIANGLSITTSADSSLTLPLNANVSGTLTKSGDGVLSFAGSSGGIAQLSIPSLIISDGQIRLSNGLGSGNRTLLTLGALSITHGSLDVGSNDIDFKNASLASIQTELGNASITSSTAAEGSAHLTGLGAIQNTVDGTTNGAPLYGSGAGMLGLFDGVNPSPTDVLLKFTYFGDTNLDGKVDGSDYSRIDAGFLSQTPGWYGGDFNYDGTIDGSDFTLMDNAFNNQGTAITESVAQLTEIATVPEPVATEFILFAAIGALSRRARRRRHECLS